MFNELIWSALKKLKNEDSDLFIGKFVKEECINHRIALYIQEVLMNLNSIGSVNIRDMLQSGFIKIDIEYDKSLDGDKPIDDKLSRPDILIHHRGDNSNNLLFMEIKKGYRRKRDLEKCIGAIKSPYYYKYVYIVDCLIKPINKIRVIQILDTSGTELKYEFSA